MLLLLHAAVVALWHQATLRDLEQELQDAKAQHAAHMQQLRSQHEDLESKANSMLQQAQQRLSATAMADSELSAARDKATAAVEIEALAEASGHRWGQRSVRGAIGGCVIYMCAGWAAFNTSARWACHSDELCRMHVPTNWSQQGCLNPWLPVARCVLHLNDGGCMVW